MLIRTGRGQQKKGTVSHFLVLVCIIMNKNALKSMHWITLDLFELVSVSQMLFMNCYQSRKAKICIFTKGTESDQLLDRAILETTASERNVKFAWNADLLASMDRGAIKLSSLVLSTKKGLVLICSTVRTILFFLSKFL